MTTEPTERPVSTSNPHPTRPEWEAMRTAMRDRADREWKHDATLAKLLNSDFIEEMAAVAERVLDLPARDARIRAETLRMVANELDAIDGEPIRPTAQVWLRHRAGELEANAAPAESSAQPSVVSVEGSGQGQPHWTIQLGREDARRWLAGEPRITDAEKEALRERVEGSGLAALFRAAAAGRREYAENAPDEHRKVLEIEAAMLESAARLADGDLSPMRSWLPTWRWSEVLGERPQPAEGSAHPCPSQTVHESGAPYRCTLPSGHEGMHQVSVVRFWGDAEGSDRPHPTPGSQNTPEWMSMDREWTLQPSPNGESDV